MSTVELILEKVVRGALRSTFKQSSRLPLKLSTLRKAADAGALMMKMRADATVEYIEMAGVNVAVVSPSGFEPTHTMLHMHGGAFFAGSVKTHLALASELAVRSEARVYLLEYRLAPEHPYPAAIEDGLAVYEALLDAYTDPASLYLSGDSAGGGMVLAMAQHLKQTGQTLPAGMVLISPFVDLSLTASTITEMADVDPMLAHAFLQRGGDAYRGEISEYDPRVSPLFGEFSGLPRMLIQCGTDEVLRDDTLNLERKAKEAGVNVQCTIYPRMWHNFQMFNLLIGTADKALYEIAEFVRQ